MPLPVTSQDALEQHLRMLGVSPGMALVVHTRLLSFGQVDGGDRTAYNALRNVVGPEGTIIVPTFTLWLEDGEAYDRNATPSQRLGTFPEYVRSLPGARRSRCPMHNFAGVGPQADVLDTTPGTVSLGRGSDFEALHDAGFHLLFFGCNFKDAATYTMHVEALTQVPFRHWLDLPRFVIGPDGEKQPVVCRYYGRASMEWQEDLQIIEDHMMATGCVSKTPCLFGNSYLMKIADFQSHVVRLFERNPYATIRHHAPQND
jgi:aminoglycoside 3-N-acetyltransferase